MIYQKEFEEEYHIYLWISPSHVQLDSPILEPKNKFFLFLGTNYLEKLIFYLRIFFQVCYGYKKNLSWTLFDLSFWPMHKSRVIFCTDF